jgi:hypothetical protein
MDTTASYTRESEQNTKRYRYNTSPHRNTNSSGIHCFFSLPDTHGNIIPKNKRTPKELNAIV